MIFLMGCIRQKNLRPDCIPIDAQPRSEEFVGSLDLGLPILIERKKTFQYSGLQNLDIWLLKRVDMNDHNFAEIDEIMQEAEEIVRNIPNVAEFCSMSNMSCRFRPLVITDTTIFSGDVQVCEKFSFCVPQKLFLLFKLDRSHTKQVQPH